MSSAALAKKRRAAQQPVQTPTPLPTPPQNPSVQNQRVPVSIPQMFSLMEKRINTLEKEMKTFATKPNADVENNKTADEDSKKIFEEYEARFELLAMEISTIKDVLLNLQTYTINVNRVLLEQNGTIDVPDLSQEPLLKKFKEDVEKETEESKEEEEAKEEVTEEPIENSV